MKIKSIIICSFLVCVLYGQNPFIDSLLELDSLYQSFIMAEEGTRSDTFLFDSSVYASLYTEQFTDLLTLYSEDAFFEISNREEFYYTEALVYFELLFYTTYLRDFYFQADPELNALVSQLFEDHFSPQYFVFNPYLPISRDFFYFAHKRIEAYIQSHWFENNKDRMGSFMYSEVERQQKVFSNDGKAQNAEIQNKKVLDANYYRAVSAVDSMYVKFLEFQNTQGIEKSFQLSEDIFYAIINDPAMVYVLFYNEVYFPLRDAFLSSAQFFLEIDDTKIIDSIQNPEFDSVFYKKVSLFYDYFYAHLYAKVEPVKQKVHAALVYHISDLLLQSFTLTARYGFFIYDVLTEDNHSHYEAVLQNPFVLPSLDEIQLISFKTNLEFINLVSNIYLKRINALPSVQMRGR